MVLILLLLCPRCVLVPAGTAKKSPLLVGLDSLSLAAVLLARNVGMPIHERTVWIVLPCPDMQRVERWETEAIGKLEVVKKLPHELRWALILLVPCVGENQKVGPN